MRKIMLRVGAIGAIALFAVPASAQITWVPDPLLPNLADPAQGLPANMAFPVQNLQGPTGVNYQVSYPYAGQCLADPANQALFPASPLCTALLPGNVVRETSFDCPIDPATTLPYPGVSNQSAGGWSVCGAPIPFKELRPQAPSAAQAKFIYNFLNPFDYTPDKASYPGADYYEIGLHEAWGFSTLASIGLFPNPPAGSPAVPDGMQWTGLVCDAVDPVTLLAVPCTCPAGLEATFQAAYCSGVDALGNPAIPIGAPIYTPIWGVGQINGPLTGAAFWPGKASPWSANNYPATWPSVSIRANRGTPVVVKWVNEFPNSHVLCPHADAADWPCSIDRTFMGVKATIDPAIAASQLTGVDAEKVNPFGSPQQPDNSWVTHLHGGYIPPSTDGFAEKWFGNAVTAKLYNDPAKPRFVTPPFENPAAIHLFRPAGNSDIYTYPMVQEEMTIWFHDHTLGKTHHNVIAGPAGFFPVKEPLKHGGVLNGQAVAGQCLPGYPGCTAEYTWLDPVTEIRSVVTPVSLSVPRYDLFIAVQDRAFNDDGSINFSNGLGQTLAPLFPGNTSVTNGVNPLVHPTWVPEYFGEYSVVNGVLWPNQPTEPGWYRLRIVDGSDSRCYTIGFQTMAAGALPPAPGANVSYNTPFYVLANDQGYLKNPVLAPRNRFSMCPGERYELLVNFGALPGIAAGAAADVYMVNNAGAPFPNGISPQGGFAPDLNLIMKFTVNPANGPGIKSCGATIRQGRVNVPVAPAALTWNPNDMAANTAVGAFAAAPANYSNICLPANPALVADPNFVDIRPLTINPFPAGSIVRQMYLNEKVDGVSLAPLGMQINGVPFEYKVTETPKEGTQEIWQIINLTVDAHPMHPHLAKHQIVARQTFNVGAYKAALCQGTTCQPGPAPGNEMQVVPDVTPFLTGQPTLVTAASFEGGWKDASQAPPRFVTTIVANWDGLWPLAGAPGATPAPGTAGACVGTPTTPCPGPFYFEPVTSGPFVWHCHINSHEDSEMMRTSLVVQ